MVSALVLLCQAFGLQDVGIDLVSTPDPCD